MKRTTLIILVILLLSTSLSVSFADEISEWAENSITQLQEYNILQSSCFYRYQDVITREEFAHIAVKVYETIIDEKVRINNDLSFNDTNNTYIMKAATVGILSGVGEGKFAPNELLTREQMAVIMINVLRSADLQLTEDNQYIFNDQYSFNSWAVSSIYLAKANGIMSGVGQDNFDPKSHASKEQVLVMAKSMIDRYSDFTSIDPLKEIHFNDANLEKAIKSELKLSSPILYHQLKALNYLDLTDHNISDLEGIQYCSSLTYLDLRNNHIKDISLLSSLDYISTLHLDSNPITTLEALNQSYSLRTLDINDIGISDLSPLEGIVGLEVLWARNNNIVDLTPLSKMTNMTDLEVGHNRIKDISAIKDMNKLKNLIIQYNYISDISYLANKPNIDTFVADFNRIQDIDILNEINKLFRLNLSNNRIKSIKPLENMTVTYAVTLDHNPYQDYLEVYEIHKRLSERNNTLYIYYYGLSDLDEIKAVSIKGTEILNEIILPGMDVLEKEKAIHDYLAKTIVYDVEGSNNSSINFKYHTPYGALIDGIAVCNGYSFTFEMLALSSGIECFPVSGDRHAWTAVKIEDGWVFVDLTWNDTNEGVKYDYYNISKEQLLKDHIIDYAYYYDYTYE